MDRFKDGGSNRWIDKTLYENEMPHEEKQDFVLVRNNNPS